MSSNESRRSVLALRIWGMVIVSLVSLAAFSFIGQGFEIILKSKQTDSWVKHDAKLLEFEAAVSDSGNSRASAVYSISVKYKFNINNKEFTGDVFSHSYPLVSWNKAEAEIERKRYDQKEIIKIYVNPLDPSESVVQPHMRGKVWQPIIFGIVFAMLPFILLYYFIKTPLPRY
ncbi:MAG: DUF3592 domain-containing protein [Verrucomicrobia bacterium]|nr:MAG: DUF3592 domain-containing protein [Verrucomicrobiota bacterium]